MSGIEDAIVKNWKAFVGFARSRTGDQHLAEDVVQESLLKALAAAKKPSDEKEITQWFYRILRRSIIDVYRREGARKRSLERLQKELPATAGPEEERILCGCFRRLMAGLPESQRGVLDKVDLQRKDPAEVAAEEGVTRNNLTVRLHRARRELRKLLEQSCGACSKHGCLDCTCEETAKGAHSH